MEQSVSINTTFDVVISLCIPFSLVKHGFIVYVANFCFMLLFIPFALVITQCIGPTTPHRIINEARYVLQHFPTGELDNQ